MPLTGPRDGTGQDKRGVRQAGPGALGPFYVLLMDSSQGDGLPGR
ncbi:hypothetical protein QF036_005013 [Arthrobacter globiformis]|nr:hypothetical protein [Arthrobacter globiformis]